jgi:hypothetical protein
MLAPRLVAVNTYVPLAGTADLLLLRPGYRNGDDDRSEKRSLY